MSHYRAHVRKGELVATNRLHGKVTRFMIPLGRLKWNRGIDAIFVKSMGLNRAWSDWYRKRSRGKVPTLSEQHSKMLADSKFYGYKMIGDEL